MDPEGIEPSPFPCEGNALPLSYGPLIVAGAGIAPAPRAYETRVVLLHHPAMALIVIFIIKIISKFKGIFNRDYKNICTCSPRMFLVNNQIFIIS